LLAWWPRMLPRRRRISLWPARDTLTTHGCHIRRRISDLIWFGHAGTERGDKGKGGRVTYSPRIWQIRMRTRSRTCPSPGPTTTTTSPGRPGRARKKGGAEVRGGRDGIAWVSEPSQSLCKQIPSKQPAAAILSVLEPISVSVLVRFLAAFRSLPAQPHFASSQQTLFSLHVRTLIIEY
jgi:hypothetical protein